MKIFYLIAFQIIILVSSIYAQQDNIFEILDSLDNSFGVKSVSYSESKKYNFKPGEIPVYDDSEYKSRVEELNTYSPFKFSYNKIVKNYINRYLKSPKSLSYIIQRTEFYFPLFEKHLNSFNLPLELKNLAIVESGLNPVAKSHCGAAGLWQFMYGTAKSYHLEINSLVDERFNPEKETIAACKYLKDLYDLYKDWPLALAAYNCGPGNVNKAIKRAGGSRNFWEIYDYLPKETQGYVPGFIAASYVTKYYELHNIVPDKNAFLYEQLDYLLVNERNSLKYYSKELKVDYKKLKYLNPQYIADIIPGKNNVIVYPSNEFINLKVENSPTLNVTESNIKGTSNLKNDTVNKTQQIDPFVKTQKEYSRNRFGTFYLNNGEYYYSHENTSEFSNILNKSITVIALSKDTISVKPGKVFVMENKSAFYMNGEYIKENSKLYIKPTFYKNSIELILYKIEAFNKSVNTKLIAEILEKPNNNNYLIDNTSVVIFKS